MGLLEIVDANGAPQVVSVPQPGTAADASALIAPNLPSGPGPYTYQQLLPANPVRAGWWIRNRSADIMYVTEDGSVPGAANLTAIAVYPGEVFPPPGVGYPITQGVVYVAGTAGDEYSCKVW